MAANEYYYGGDASYHLPPIDFDDRPPPPPASEKPYPSPTGKRPNVFVSPVSPVESPFHDHSYPSQASHPGNSRPSYGQEPSSYSPDAANPFADDVPLRQYPSQGQSPPLEPKDSSGQQFHPGLENGLPPSPDQEATGQKRGKRSKRRFNPLNPKNRTPWFVYIMTLIQITVFIAEVANNCKSPRSESLAMTLMELKRASLDLLLRSTHSSIP